MVVTQLTLKEILEIAIQKEADAQFFYLDLSHMLNDRAAQAAFQGLSKQEKGHQEFLERYLRGELKEGALHAAEVIDYKISEKLSQPEISIDMKLKDVFLLAAERERLAHEFYLSFAGVHPSGKVKQLLEELALQELGHKKTVEDLYTQVAFPQTDGG